MGVNWQKNDVYHAIKASEKESGVDFATQNALANPYGSHSFGGLLLSQGLPQLLSGGMEFFAGKAGGGSSKKVEEETIDPEKLKKDIQTVLDKYKNQGITSVEELEAYLQIRYDETDSNIKSLESCIPENETERDNLINRNTEIDTRLGVINTLLGNGSGSITSQLAELEKQISAFEAEAIPTTDLVAQKLELEKQLEELPEEKKTLEAEKRNNTANLTKLIANIALQKVNLDKFKGIQADIDEIKGKQLELDKADGKESASTLVNTDTQTITNLIKEYNQSQMNGDSEKKGQLETQLKKALQEYVDNPENKNITIRNYAEKYFQIRRK